MCPRSYDYFYIVSEDIKIGQEFLDDSYEVPVEGEAGASEGDGDCRDGHKEQHQLVHAGRHLAAGNKRYRHWRDPTSKNI